MKKILALLLLTISGVNAAPLNDFTFKSPSFSGSGYSSHVLTIENQEATRRKAREDAIQAAIDKKIAEDKNTNLAKFVSNLESRIYAQISQNVATAMFANNGCTTSTPADQCNGSIVFQNNTISWQRTTNPDTFDPAILLTIKAPGQTDADATKIWVPLSSFVIPGT